MASSSPRSARRNVAAQGRVLAGWTMQCRQGKENPDDTKIGLLVSIHYELYDGVPVISKWVTVHNQTELPIMVDRYTSEELAVVEHSNSIETRPGAPLPRPDYLHVETNFAFGGFSSAPANRHVVHWRTDPTYKTQVNYLLQTPCLLVCQPTYGPAQRIKPGEEFEGFRVFELIHDNGNRERRFDGLSPHVSHNRALGDREPHHTSPAYQQAQTCT